MVSAVGLASGLGTTLERRWGLKNGRRRLIELAAIDFASAAPPLLQLASGEAAFNRHVPRRLHGAEGRTLSQIKSPILILHGAGLSSWQTIDKVRTSLDRRGRLVC